MLKSKHILISLVFCLLTVFSQAQAEQLLSKKLTDGLKKEFKTLTGPVKLLIFSQDIQCGSCAQVEQLLTELTALSPLITVEKYDIQKNLLLANNYKVKTAPAIIPLAAKDKDLGVRFLGIPAGYEFANLIAAIKDVSRGTSELAPGTIERLKKIKKPVNIQVLITPTCPYCQSVVRLAHQFAIQNKFIQATMVELTEFPYLAQKYNVVGVPTTVINEKIAFSGEVSEEVLLRYIEKIAN